MNSRFVTMALGALLLQGVYACGDDEDAATQSDPAALVSACESYCEASSVANCGALTEAQCKAGCREIPELLDGVCIDEYAATFECTSGATFTCMEGVPVPQTVNGCVAESQNLFGCLEDLECRQYCKGAVAAGCGGADEESCVSSCQAELADYDEVGGCDLDYKQLLSCQASRGIACDGDQPGAAGCEREVLEVAYCTHFEEGLCDSYCRAAGTLGCGEECAATCEANVADNTCGSTYDRLLQCQLLSSEATCNQDGTLTTGEDCNYDQQQYELCLSSG